MLRRKEGGTAGVTMTHLSRELSRESAVAVQYVLEGEEDDFETRIQRKTDHMFDDEEQQQRGDTGKDRGGNGGDGGEDDNDDDDDKVSTAPPDLNRNTNRAANTNPGAVRIISSLAGARQQDPHESFYNHDGGRDDDGTDFPPGSGGVGIELAQPESFRWRTAAR